MPPEKPDGPAGRRRDYEARMLPAENKVAERLRSALAKGRQNPAQVLPAIHDGGADLHAD